MRCIRPDRLADFQRGRLGERRARAVEAHLAGCDRCRAALARIGAAHEALREVLELPVPDVGSVRGEATVRWTRALPRKRVRPAFLWALSAASWASALIALTSLEPSAPRPEPAKAPIAKKNPSPPAPQPTSLEALVTLVGGDVRVAHGSRSGAAVDAGTTLRAGDRLTAQADAHLAAQWGDGSGLLLAGAAELAIVELEPAHQRFALERGKVNVRVRHHDGESLEVLAPGHVVAVRGTWFSVAADGNQTLVDVLEGVVEVTDRSGRTTTLLRAPASGVFGRGRAQTTALTRERAAEVRASELNLIPWPSLQAARDTSGLLSIGSEPSGLLAVDGVQLGATPLKVRRPLGRHLVEIAHVGFEPVRRWVSLGQEPGDLRLALPRVVEHKPTEEPVSVEEMVHARGRQIRACYERGLKRDPTLAGTVSLKLRVGDAGQVRSVVVEESTLDDPLVGDCLRHEAAGWSFKTGRNATVVYPFVFRPQ
jgi:ferric-dicitrate binding protein FerR (iron transport regulator)